jgi:hypothetical protein
VTTVALTFDVDWAPELVLADVLELLEDAGASATFFATHDSQALRAAQSERIELGVHPDFRGTGDDLAPPLRRLLDIFPGARGVRSHLLIQSSPLCQVLVEEGLDYESNTHLPFHRGLHPVTRVPGLVSIPYAWSDDTHFRLRDDFKAADLPLDGGLAVVAFHPIHVFMNTRSSAHYESYRGSYLDAAALAPHRNRDAPGVRTLFESLLGQVRAGSVATCTLARVCDEYRVQT